MSADDPFGWLEDLHGEQALAWAGEQTKATLRRLEGDPRFATLHAQARAIATAEDRLPWPSVAGGHILNLWRDDTHPRGLWRRTDPAGYATETPTWDPLLDLDALSAAEGKALSLHGTTFLEPDETRVLLALSDGGTDAVSIREFDMTRAAFVEDTGFTLPPSKQTVAWEDTDTLLVTRDWGPGTLTRSGYPFVTKRLKRGQSLDQAEEVFRGDDTDQVGCTAWTLTDTDGKTYQLISRFKTFFTAEQVLVTAAGPRPLPLPESAYPLGLLNGRLVVYTKGPWPTAVGPTGPGPAIGPGAVVSLPFDALARGEAPRPIPVFTPGPRQTLAQAAVTKSRLVIAYFDTVRGRLSISSPRADGTWDTTPVDGLPDNATFGLLDASHRSDQVWLSVTAFLTPSSLWRLEADTGAVQRVKQSPARFDASGLITEQREATAPDGIAIPYFVIRPADAPMDGSTPTILYAYGGFQVPMTSSYLADVGKLWLERGGAYVIANIRGGGEFGPEWHEAAAKTKRQVAYDDFYAVADALVADGLTRPDRLGIAGASNGGLLMGVAMTQRPDRWGAVSIGVPLLDMLRFEELAAGPSWVWEYGSVSVPEERTFLASISPYHALRRDAAYPEPFVWTATSDDRVGPQHARKFAARMLDQGHPCLFYEDMAGGHSLNDTLTQAARRQALEMVYFLRKLTDGDSP